MNGDNGMYFSKFWVEYVSKKIKRFIGNKDTITNVFTIQAYHPIIYRHFCIGFIDLKIKGKSLLDIPIHFC